MAAALAVVTLMAGGPVRADTQQQLDAAKKRLNQLVAKVQAEQSEVNAIEADVSALALKISDVQAHIAETQAQIVDIQGKIEQASRDLQEKQDQLDLRVRTAFENGPGSGLEFVLGATSLTDLSDRIEIVNRAAQSDEQLINQIHERQNRLHIQQVKLDSLETRLRSQEADLRQQQQALVDKLAAAQSVLRQLERDRSEAEALVEKLKKKRAAEIAAARAALAAVQGSHGGSSIGGVFFRCPVDQPRGYGDDFGAPRYGGGFHLHAGNDIFAPRGTPIRAPFSGSASDASNGLGGLAVYVHGAAGYVYNAHLDSLGKLGSVSTGDVVGYVGDSGDARGGLTHDHFEWHPNVIPSNLWRSSYGVTQVGSAIDPYPYLNSVC
jgi:peptidoglycan hydrolase CwlO-like protein